MKKVAYWKRLLKKRLSKLVMSKNKWQKTTLGAIACRENGLVDGPFGSNLPASSYTEQGIPVIRGSNLSLGSSRFKDDEFVFVSENTAAKLSRSLCFAGDIIFTKKGTLGQTGFIPTKHRYNRFLLSSNQMKLTVQSALADPLFIYYLVSSDASRKKLIQDASVTGVPKTNVAYLKSFPILLPPLYQQQQIAAILSSLDDKIELNQRMNQTLEQLAQTLFRQWFVTFDFPTAGRPYRSSGGELVTSELGEIPKGWQVSSLEELGKIVCGKTPANNSEFFKGSLPFIKIPDMHGNIFIIETGATLTREGANTQRKKSIPKHSICVSCIGTVGLISITSEESQTNQQINSIVPNLEHFRYFLFLSLKNLKLHLQMLAGGGSTIPNLNTGNFAKILLSRPDDNILQAFHTTIEPLFDQILVNQTQSRTLATLRDTLLPQLLSGRLTVRQAEELVA
ncbi:restriction endonuclease subunit S [Hymenobacter sp. BT683]|uniref:Restriction endonuclease subunit S n=1 Tax=Hymenobacter jeongseonensis TaxID=2791027 RepID=A0ABS0IEL2_9BACT|nr:restriction endonuclease subunit S [Hymenobacter jeongseonensis]MBF9236775.1 restriction endonuclease subunit S [Hymenobacter jeongseonensis]